MLRYTLLLNGLAALLWAAIVSAQQAPASPAKSGASAPVAAPPAAAQAPASAAGTPAAAPPVAAKGNPAPATGSAAAATAPLAAPVLPPPAVPAPSIAARTYLLVDLTSRQTLVAQAADEKRDPASLTKLMTAYLAFNALKQKQITMGQVIKVSEKAWRAEGSRMFIEPQKPVTVEELLRGMIIQSGNDASIALAETIAGSEEAFAEQMNREAKKLGMKNTNFTNATGLSGPQHHSTATDLALLAAAIIRDFPEFYTLYSVKEYRYNNISQSNRNRLLWTDPYVDGMKTGFTEAAGYCLVASSKRGQRRLLTIVMGASSDAGRAAESQKLLNYGFQYYDTLRLYEKGQSAGTLRIWKGARNDLAAGFAEDVYLTVPKGASEKLKVTMEAVEPLIAPVLQGQRVGTIRVALEGKPVADFPLVALSEVPIANLFGRAWDTIRLWFK